MKIADLFHRAHHDESSDADDGTVHGLPAPSSVPVAANVLSGMAAGAVVGSIAGPPGLLAGAVVGSAVGVAASIALDAQNAEDEAMDEALDRDIGVIGGDLGEARPDQPPAKRGLYSAAAMGVSTESSVELNEGPMSGVEDD